MKAFRVDAYGSPARIQSVAEPRLADPHDVIVRVSGAGVCRTDLHVVDGAWAAVMDPSLPLTLGHETAGLVSEVGAAVASVRVGDPVLLHPAVACGTCGSCRAGAQTHCSAVAFPGLTRDGGMAEYVLTTESACVRLDPATDLKSVAGMSDAGISAYHAVKKSLVHLDASSTCVVVGAGGLGHLAVQMLSVLTDASVIVVDPSERARDAALDDGAHHALPADGHELEAVLDLTEGRGAGAVFDFVGSGSAAENAYAMTARGGVDYVVGYGGTLTIPTIDLITMERSIVGNNSGTFAELVELMALVGDGRVSMTNVFYPLDDAAAAMDDLAHGRVHGRAVLVP